MEILRKSFSILLIFGLIFLQGSVLGQKKSLNNPEGKLAQRNLIPLDSSVRMGHLPNGLVYYIRKNQEPANRAELRLVVNAGSLLEQDNQLGLAHFTEHMAFNGTEHFQKNDLTNFLEKAGIKFGADLNAQTSFDETVYQLSLPTDSAHSVGDSLSLYEKGFLILKDWMHGLSFRDDEIEKERGVVIEEWRLGRGANARLRDQYFPVVFKNSRYAIRLPIGNKDSLMSFSHQALKNFYQDWYRPDLEAIVVVGDINLNKTESLIKKQFASLENPLKERKRNLYALPEHQETRIAIVTDKEQPYTIVQWVKQFPKRQEITLEDWQKSLSIQLYNYMMKERITEILHLPNAPFLYANASYTPFLRSNDVFENFVVVKGGSSVLEGVKALINEDEKVKQYGFTKSEFDRAKKEVYSSIEKQYHEKDKTNSKTYVKQYVDNFLNGSPIPGIAFEFEYLKSNLNKISLSSLNSLANIWLQDGNRYSVITAPEKEKAFLPSSGELLNALKFDKRNTLKPYVDNASSQTLMDKDLPETSINKVKSYPDIGLEEYTLQNGMHILLKPTQFRNDQILFSGFRKGGASNYSDAKYLNAIYATPVVQESGVGKFNNINLSKVLAGKEIRVNPYLDQYQQGFTGGSTIKDFETALQLIYLNFTSPRKDPEAFKALLEKESAYLQNRNADPAVVFADSISAIMSGHNLRNKSITSNDIPNINLDSAFSIFKQSFSNPKEFTFVFIGNFESKSLLALISKYLGNIPSGDNSSTIKDDLKDFPKGFNKKVVYKGTEPKSQVRIFYSGQADFSRDLQDQLNILTSGLGIKLRENLREDKGGTYGVGIHGGIMRFPRKQYSLEISFGCAPENVDTLIKATLQEVETAKLQGLDTIYIEKVKAQNRLQLELSIKKNEFWLKSITEYCLNGDDLDAIVENTKGVLKVTRDQTKMVANKFFGENRTIIVLKPEKK